MGLITRCPAFHNFLVFIKNIQFSTFDLAASICHINFTDQNFCCIILHFYFLYICSIFYYKRNGFCSCITISRNCLC